jgi:hypothetical protein
MTDCKLQGAQWKVWRDCGEVEGWVKFWGV